MEQKIGTSFQSSEVVDLYLYRPPYPQQIFDLIVALSPKTEHLLDLGCGHGKIARPMSRHFQRVTAIDPSAEMMTLGKSLDHGQAANLTWIEGLAETAPLSGPYDTVVAALSIHWMAHDTLFPRLAMHLKTPHLFAVVEGDGPYDPPWQDDWVRFHEKWVPKLTGAPFQPDKGRTFWTMYETFVTVQDRYDVISDPLHQSIEDFILCQHSRDTFAISKLGQNREEFDDELRAILRPFADAHDMLEFRSITKLTTATL